MAEGVDDRGRARGVRLGLHGASDLAVIETSVGVANSGSARVLEKLGFRWTRRSDERWEKEASPVQLDWYELRRDWR